MSTCEVHEESNTSLLVSRVRDRLKSNTAVSIGLQVEAPLLTFDERVSLIVGFVTDAKQKRVQLRALGEKQSLGEIVPLGAYEHIEYKSETANVQALCDIERSVRILLQVFPTLGTRAKDVQKVLMAANAIIPLRLEKKADDMHYVCWLTNKLSQIQIVTNFFEKISFQ